MFNRAYIEITNLCNFHCDFCPRTGTTRSAHGHAAVGLPHGGGKAAPADGLSVPARHGRAAAAPGIWTRCWQYAASWGFKTCITHQRPVAAQKV